MGATIFATAEAMGQTISVAGAKMIADDLASYDEPVIAAALQACRREQTGRISLGLILKHVHAADGRPGKDEAWSIALSADDEYATVVLTTEIRQAMIASAPVLAAGDKIGARMAFLSAYERLVSVARAEDRPARWEVSLGFDQAGRAVAIDAAVRAKLITHDAGAKYLADLRIAPVTTDGQAIAGLLTGQVHNASADVRSRLDGIRQQLQKNSDRNRRKKGQRDRVDTYLSKRRLRLALAALTSEATECQ